MSSEIKAFVSQRTVLDDEVSPAIVVVLNEKIHEVICGDINEKIKHVKNVSFCLFFSNTSIET